jgi:hypothetical protein
MKCGQALPDDAAFCPYCGQSMQERIIPSKPKKPVSSLPLWGILLLSFAGLFFLVAFILIAASGRFMV